uniref:Reverse transcriptase/retrotransposon-derived protein RNase H-like domain-containing protein n=1 Tax=Salarias fasciatus TaxID=181472 RepID=A0A672GST9_SALFA
MKDWLLQRYASSTFNTCPHRALPCMEGPPIEMHVDPGTVPKACHTVAVVPLHWQQRVYEDLLRDEALGVIERPFLSPRCKFAWSAELEQAFQSSKSAIIESIREGVEIYDTQKRTCLRPDWSRRGIGYFLLQKHCDCVAAGSRFLSPAEQRYAAIEGEALAVAWGLEGLYDGPVCPCHSLLARHGGGHQSDQERVCRL